MRQALLVFLFIMSGSVLWAQSEFIQFDHTEHDFGKRKEEEETLEHTFKLKNISGAPIKLIYVKASCGCTTPSYTSEVIKPNQEGFVKASYGAKGRPGAFNKSITVRAAKVDPKTNAVLDSNTTDTKVLYIKGDVSARVKGVRDVYPMEDGNLRFSTNHLAFGTIKTNIKDSREFTVFNQGKKPITISEFKNDNKHITINFTAPVTLKPNDSTRFKVTFDATQLPKTQLDWNHSTLSMMTTDDSTSNQWQKNTPGDKKIYVSATVEEFFTDDAKLTAPKIEFEKEVHDFGELKQGDKVKTTFVFKNTGKSELVIHKSKASCGCTASQPEKTNIKPGETSKIDVEFDSTGKEGPTSKQITVVCNDPAKPVTRLEIKCNIKKPGDPKPGGGAGDHSGHNH